MDPIPLCAPQLLKSFKKALPGIGAHERMASRKPVLPEDIPENARESAVLILLQEEEEELHVILIERTVDRSAHSGQIAFPGGRRDPEDASLLQTALREAQEEVALDATAVSVLGGLTPLYIPVSGFHVYPFVAYTPVPLKLYPSPVEVKRILQIPLSALFAPQNRIIAEIKSVSNQQTSLQVPAYRLPDDGTIIWGATAMILSELQTLLSDG